MKHFLLLLLCTVFSHLLSGQDLNGDYDLDVRYSFNGNFIGEGRNDQDAVPKNGATLGRDRFGFLNSACEFDGVDDYFEVSKLWDQYEGTLLFWMKVTSDDPTKVNTIYSEGSSNSSQGVYIQVQGTKLILSGRYLYSSPTEVAAAIEVNTWIHVALTSDNRGFNEDDVRLYINGNRVGTIESISHTNGSNKYLGAYPTLDRDFFQGSIDDVRRYDRDLNDDEVLEIYKKYDPYSIGGGLSEVGNAWKSGEDGVSYTDGHVQIGDVTTPTGYSLFVKDGILTEKVKISMKDGSQWADYVFAPEYDLKPLSEVEDYVKTHQHLPGIPSADSLIQTGIDLVQMNAKLLEKIEELTLYVIDQNKAIRRLESNCQEK